MESEIVVERDKWAVKKEQKRGFYDRDYRCVVCRGLDSGKLKVFPVSIGHNLYKCYSKTMKRQLAA